jgi:hypothetical protein
MAKFQQFISEKINVAKTEDGDMPPPAKKPTSFE